MSSPSSALPTVDWAPENDPWYRVGVWFVIYGGILAAPTLTVVLLMGTLAALGWLPLDGEFFWLSGVGGISGGIALLGFALIRRSRKHRQHLHELDESYWFYSRD